jgi:hypothetical protein
MSTELNPARPRWRLTGKERLVHVRMVERALAQGWPVPDSAKAEAVEAMRAVVSDPNASPREKSAAAHALVLMTRVNLEAIGTALEVDRHVSDRLDREEAEDALERDLRELEDAGGFDDDGGA